MALRPIYYDTETTGIKADKERIIEIAAFDPVLDKTFCSFINPKIPIPKEATAIHHITDEMVKDSPGFDEVGQDFVKFCEGETVLIAHNNDSFDKFFLIEEFKRNSLVLPDFKYIDSLKWARKYRYDLPRHSLQYLREIYQIPSNNAHRALDDVIVLYKIFSKMIDDLSIETVFERLNAAQVDRMPFGKHRGKPLSEVPSNYVQWLCKNEVFTKEENKNLFEKFKNLGILEKTV